MKTETTFSIDYYDSNNDWCDGDAEYGDYQAAVVAAESGLRNHSGRKYAVVSRTKKTKLTRVELTAHLEEIS